MDRSLVDRLRAAAEQSLPNLPIRFAYLYGSRAGGRPRPDSDIDVGVLLDGRAAVTEPERIASRCTDALLRVAGVGGIETTVLNGAPIRFLGRVLRHRVVLYSADEPGRVAYESRVGRMADDVEVWAAPMDQELIAAVAAGRR